MKLDLGTMEFQLQIGAFLMIVLAVVVLETGGQAYLTESLAAAILAGGFKGGALLLPHPQAATGNKSRS